jgi:hypothetical protein
MPPAPIMTTLKFDPGAGGGCLSIAKSVSSVERRRTGVFPGGMLKEACLTWMVSRAGFLRICVSGSRPIEGMV